MISLVESLNKQLNEARFDWSYLRKCSKRQMAEIGIAIMIVKQYNSNRDKTWDTFQEMYDNDPKEALLYLKKYINMPGNASKEFARGLDAAMDNLRQHYKDEKAVFGWADQMVNVLGFRIK